MSSVSSALSNAPKASVSSNAARSAKLKADAAFGAERLNKLLPSGVPSSSMVSKRAGARERDRLTPRQSTSMALTERERAIVQLIANGRSNKEAARVLGISVKTIETHRASIMRKLGFTSIVSLVRYAVRERFIKA